jgi:general secretion pathway protein H
MRSCAGFSLLELMLVLLLLGLAYGLTGPMLGDKPVGLEMQSAARQIAAGLRKARVTAVAQNHEAVLTLDVGNREFAVSGDTKTYALPKSLDYSLFTAQSELVRERTGNIRFFPDGSSTGGRVTIGSGKARRTVDVDWITGRVKIR